MTPHALSYAVVTPVRNEAENLERVARCIEAQTIRPTRWVLVDTGSTDDTATLVDSLATEHPWIEWRAAEAAGVPTRGGPIVRAFQAGLDALARLEQPPHVVVKLDADVSFERDYFERLLDAFAGDPLLGMASGSAYELQEGEWRQRHVTGTSVWGASRAYRRECLRDVLPLEERMGWDGIDEMKAKGHGWRTETLTELPFRHHRREGERDGAPRAAWVARGRAAHYMGYRPWYLLLRALHHSRRDRAALAMVTGYAGAALRREPTCADRIARQTLRSEQTFRGLRRRRRQALGLESRAGPSRPGAPPREGGRPAAHRLSAPVDVLLVCSGGGHLLELWSLRDAWAGYDRAWVIASHEGSDVESLLDGERHAYCYAPTNRNLLNLVRNAAVAWRLLGRLRPCVVVTTGAGVAVPFAWVARIRGIRAVYVESLARSDAPSLSGRLVRPAVDRLYVQWPQLARAFPGARYVGTVFTPR